MRTCFTVVILCFIASQVRAATKTDSILAVTGGKHTKMAWVRWQWADDNYNPIKSQQNQVQVWYDYEQTVPFTQLMCFDTDSGKCRFVDSAQGYHEFPRISRKSGAYVIWNDQANTCSWIRDLALKQPKRKLISGGDWWILTCQYNPVTDSEFVYAFTDWNHFPANVQPVYGFMTGMNVVRYPLRADGTVDPAAKKQVVTVSGSECTEHTLAASQDGKYLGCNLAIPNCVIVEVATGIRLNRHDPAAEFGCHTNIAPDNSYRFFHLIDSHVSIAMFEGTTAPTAKMWYVDITPAMPGSTDGGNNCLNPRWSNNIQFFTNSYPLETGLMQDNNGSGIYNMTAAQLKAADASRAGSFCLAKFNADFTAVEKAVRVSGGDARYRDAVGDAWIEPSAVSAGQAVKPFDKRQKLGIDGNRVTAQERAAVALTDIMGRMVLSAYVKAGSSVELRRMGSGVYFITVKDDHGVAVSRAIIR